MGSNATPATDDRIYSLTQSLVQKQNSLEAMTAERNAIRIQLEKMENQHRETLQLLRQQRIPQTINVNDTDDAKSQVPNFMQENPFDTRVARRVKRAYSSLDAVGIRLGVFMRRYPLIRILVIFYVAVLHLWVMLVLFTSTPNWESYFHSTKIVFFIIIDFIQFLITTTRHIYSVYSKK